MFEWALTSKEPADLVAILRAAPKESPLRPRAPRKAVEVIDLISPEKAALFL